MLINNNRTRLNLQVRSLRQLTDTDNIDIRVMDSLALEVGDCVIIQILHSGHGKRNLYTNKLPSWALSNFFLNANLYQVR